MMCIHMTFSKKTTPLHSTELFKIFFSLLTLSTAFLQKASGPGKNCRKLSFNLNEIYQLELDARFKNFQLERKRECATAEYLWRTTVYVIS